MARRPNTEDTDERILAKLERIEGLLVDLIILEACVADANRMKIARLLGVDNGRVSRVSGVLKRRKVALGTEG